MLICSSSCCSNCLLSNITLINLWIYVSQFLTKGVFILSYKHLNCNIYLFYNIFLPSSVVMFYISQVVVAHYSTTTAVSSKYVARQKWLSLLLFSHLLWIFLYHIEHILCDNLNAFNEWWVGIFLFTYIQFIILEASNF